MKRVEFSELEPGTPLLVGDKFTTGDSEDFEAIKHLLNRIITFTEIKDEWVYHEEVPDTPFHVSEIACVADMRCLDDETVDYQLGNIGLIFGEV